MGGIVSGVFGGGGGGKRTRIKPPPDVVLPPIPEIPGESPLPTRQAERLGRRQRSLAGGIRRETLITQGQRAGAFIPGRGAVGPVTLLGRTSSDSIAPAATEEEPSQQQTSTGRSPSRSRFFIDEITPGRDVPALFERFGTKRRRVSILGDIGGAGR